MDRQSATNEAEAAIRASDHDLSRIINTIPALVWSARPDGAAEFFNQHYLDYVGLPAERAQGWGWAAAVHPDDLETLAASWRTMLATGRPGGSEARFRRFDGEYRWFLCRANPLRDEHGRIVKWYGTNIDIEDRKRAEERTRLIVDTALDAVIAIDAHGTITTWNKEAEITFGWSHREAIGRQLSDLIIPERLRLSHHNGLRQFLTTGEGPILRRRIEVAAVRRSGAEFPVELEIVPMRLGADWVFSAFIRDITDSKHAEEKLRRSELHARLMVDSIPAVVVVMTAAGDIEHVNRQMQDYFGKTLAELHRWETSGVIHPDDLTRVLDALAQSIDTGVPFDAELRCRRFDGVYRWFQARGLPLRDADERIDRWYFLLTDVEDRKQAESQLAGEKRLLEMIASGRSIRDVLEAICRFIEETIVDCHCGIYPIDWSGPTFSCGAAPSLPVSYTDPIEGMPVNVDLVPCGIAAREKIQVIVADIESDRRWHTYRDHLVAHRLRSVWSTPICSLEGRQVLGTLCVYHSRPATPAPHHQELIAHVTHIASIAIERSQADAALARTDTLLADGQRISMTGTFSWRLDTDEIRFSDELHRIFEFDRRTPVTLEQVGARVHPEDLSFLSSSIARVRAGGDDSDYEIRLRMPDGSIKYLHTFSRVIRNHDGRRECLGAVQDITQRRVSAEALDKARSELAHVSRAMTLGTMTASIAHEVNQPLSGIITNASTCLRMLAADPPNIDGARETARRTIRDGNRASDVIARLRALFSRKPFTTEPVDLNEATREVIALSLSELQRHQAVLRVELAGDLPPVNGDRVQLQQVILNLLRNAAEAMVAVHDRPRQLVVRTGRASEDRVQLTVRDVGIGLEPDSVDKLFEAFHTTKVNGMGIGLSISRSIVERHRGRLWAESNDGAGATFAFSIPLWPEGTAAVAPAMRNR